MAVELAEEVEGVDVSHAADVVQYGLDAGVDVGRMDVVLLRHFPQQQLGEILVGMHRCIHQYLHEVGDDAVARNLYVHYVGAAVDAAFGHPGAMCVGVAESV